MAMGDGLRASWWLIAALIAGTLWWYRKNRSDPKIRNLIDRSKLKLPIIGNLLIAIDIERFSRTLATLLSNGVALPAALSVAKDTLSNSVIAAAVAETALRLREGERLADRLGKEKIFPAAALDLMRIGEESGRLDEMLLRQANLDAQRIKRSIDRLLALLVPVLTIVLGLIVAGLIASMLSAILSVNDLAVQ
jgi:general secretion pathway protein F